MKLLASQTISTGASSITFTNLDPTPTYRTLIFFYSLVSTVNSYSEYLYIRVDPGNGANYTANSHFIYGGYGSTTGNPSSGTSGLEIPAAVGAGNYQSHPGYGMILVQGRATNKRPLFLYRYGASAYNWFNTTAQQQPSSGIGYGFSNVAGPGSTFEFRILSGQNFATGSKIEVYGVA